MGRRFIYLIILTVLTLPVILPFFRSGYFPTHDGEWAVVRLVEMFRSLRDGQFPVRYSGALNFGYGYPLFNFAYPLPYYLGMLPYFLGFGFVGSIKFLFVLSTLFSVIFMFLLSSNFWQSKLSGLMSAVFYLYLPYRFVDLYVRGSLGETLALMFFPLLFLLAHVLIKRSSSWLITGLASLAYASLIVSHNIMALIFTPVLLVFLLTLLTRSARDNFKERFFVYLSFLLFGLGLSAFFWLPALGEKQYISLSQTPIAERNLYFVNWRQLLVPSWGFEPPTEPEGFSYQVGVPQLLILTLVAGGLFWRAMTKKMRRQRDLTAAVFLLVIFINFFLMFPRSKFIWENTPLLSEINYPWTLLAVIGFLVSFLGGYLSKLGSKMVFLGLIIALSAIVLHYGYARPKTYVDRGETFYMTNEATTTSSDEYMPVWVKTKPLKKFESKLEILSGEIEIRQWRFDSKSASFLANALETGKIRLNTIYYPGWRAFIDDQETEINYDNEKGVMEIIVPQGKHRVEFVFGETFLRMAANLVSLSSLGLLVFFGVRRIALVERRDNLLW